jgi:hypothetical protein
MKLDPQKSPKMAVPGTAIPGTSAGGFGYAMGGGRVPEGAYTVTIYGMIRCVCGLACVEGACVLVSRCCFCLGLRFGGMCHIVRHGTLCTWAYSIDCV